MYKNEYWNSMLLFEISGHNSEAFFSEIYNYLMHIYICLNFSLRTHIMIIDRKVQIKHNFRS